MDTKQKIRQAAIKLFNESGVPEITTRHIAASIDISQGNLHYHYPNKDVLLLTLYDEYISKSSELDRNYNRVMELDLLISSMRENFSLMYNYRFLFVDRDYIWRRSPLIETNYKKLIERKRAELRETIDYFIENGTFRANFDELQIESLLDHVELVMTTWVFLTPFKVNLSPMNYSKHFSEMVFRLWVPYLTDEKLSEWDDVLKL